MYIHFPRAVRNTVLSGIALVMLVLAAGVVYVFMNDKANGSGALAGTTQVSAQVSAGAIKPQPPSPAAPEGVYVEFITTPVKAGSVANVAVRTNPTSICTATVTYKAIVSHDPGLGPQSASDFGDVSWTWTVDPAAPSGTWPVDITCTYHGRSGVVRADLTVTR